MLWPALPREVPLWLLVGLTIALCAVQLALMRWWRPLNDAVLRSAGRLAKTMVDRLHPTPGRQGGPIATQPADLARARGPSGD